jgi:D-alanyl-D-alanine carboxypeptidase
MAAAPAPSEPIPVYTGPTKTGAALIAAMAVDTEKQAVRPKGKKTRVAAKKPDAAADATADAKTETKTGAKTEAKAADAKPVRHANAKPDAAAANDNKPVAKPPAKPKTAAKTAAKPSTKPAPKNTSSNGSKPAG